MRERALAVCRRCGNEAWANEPVIDCHPDHDWVVGLVIDET